MVQHLRFLRVTLLAVLALGVSMMVVPASAAPPTALPAAVTLAAEDLNPLPGHSGVVSDVPASWTPQVLNGKVLGIGQAGGTMVVGGSFTSVSQTWGGSTQNRQRLFAFNASNGSINGSFNPSITGGQVNVVIPGPSAGTVYVGGTFPGINGQTGRVFLVNASNGQVISSFSPPSMNGQVRDLVLVGDRLFVGGLFTHVGGFEHRGLVALDAASGNRLGFLQVQLTENHNWTEGSSAARAGVGVSGVAADPAGTTLAAVGNFRKANGLDRRQMVMIDISGAQGEIRSDWRTRRYEPACYSWAFDTYMRDIAADPGGEFFVVSTTGGGNPGTLCDTVARWDISDSGDDVQPTWIDESGGDSLLGVGTSGTAVYAGGHQRWANNRNGRDNPQPGSVPRAGLTGLDGTYGIPLDWNPGRHPRGVGAEAFTVTDAGLWMGSDTEWIGRFDHRRARLAFFPTDGGYELGAGDTGSLPSNVYVAGTQQAGGDDVLFRVNAAGPSLPSLDNGPAWAADTGTTSPWRNSGSSTSSYGAVPSTTPAVPASTPREVFETERWDPEGGSEMTWSFPVASGTDVTVRLYLANRYTGTTTVGSRVFDVALDGTTVLDDHDIVADAGHDVGTVKSFDITSDGSVDVEFRHVVENPLVNAIEIVERDDDADPDPAPSPLSRVWFTGGAVADAPSAAPHGGIDWTAVRGAEMVDGELFYLTQDQRFLRRTFDGTSYGPATEIDPYRDPYWADFPTGSGDSTYGGVRPSLYNQITTVRGLAFADGEMYYTRAGSNQLFARGFSPDSGILRELTRTVAGFNQPNLGEIFFDPSGGHLYFTNTQTGVLRRVAWGDGVPQGPVEQVSGPGTDGMDWRSSALFLADGPTPEPDNEAPGAVMAVPTCDGLDCEFDGSGSSDPDGEVASYAWDFGDGSTGTGAQAGHTYAEAGTYTVTLTVTDDDGATDSTSRQVNVEPANVAPTAAVNSACEELECTFDGSGSSDPDGEVASYAWDFGDGSTGTGVQAEHTFASAGTYTVTLTVTDDDGATDTTSQDVTVAPGNLAPEAAITYLCEGLGCAFDGSESSDPDGEVASYAWDFGDGGTANGAEVMHGYDEPGDYLVTLTVTDDDGATDTASQVVTVTEGNVAPTAGMEASCVELECAFDGSGSADPDGEIASYDWDLGDGSTAQGPQVDHTYDEAGTYTVTLTVTDDEGATATASTDVTVDDGGSAGAEPQLVGVSAVQAHANSVSATVPDGVQAGDQLVAFLTSSQDEAITGPAGVGAWELEDETILSPMAARLFSRTADGSEAGQAVTVTMAGNVLAKWDLTIVAYRGAGGGGVEILRAETTRNTATHVSPLVQVTGNNRVALTYWSDRGGSTTEWAPPTGPVLLSTQVGAGGGRVSSLLVAESAGPGPYGELVAETNAPTSRAVAMTVVLRPTAGGPPPNQAPAAVVDHACDLLECSFDGSGSSDPDGSVATYAWDFGDGATATGAQADHTYASAGSYTVTLTVTDDDGATDVATRTVVVTDGSGPAAPQLVGTVAVQAHSGSVSIDVPAGVQAGDALLLFVTRNKDAGGDGPTGVGAWTLEEQAQEGPLLGRLYSRVATGAEAGGTIAVAAGELTKWDATLVVYRGTGNDPVESVASTTDRNSAALTSPEVAVSGPSRVGLSYWADRGGSTTSWTPPSGPQLLSTQVGEGGGRVGSLLVAGPATPGTYGGLVAQTNAPTSRALSMTAVLAP